MTNETMVAATVLIVVALAYLFLLGYAIFSYVLTSLSLHTLSRRRGIANPWLAWIPYGSYWIMGALAKDYDKKNGMNRKWDKILLTLSLIAAISFVIIYIVLLIFMFVNIATLEAAGDNVTSEMATEFIVPLVIIYAVLVIVMMLMMALQALVYICTYKIFESTVPEKSLKYFLLYMLVPFAGPICLFRCRNCGYEMPLICGRAPVIDNFAHNEPISEDAPTQE